VGNDGGGTIFDALEVAGSAPPEAFDRVQFTPQQVDFSALARRTAGATSGVTTRGELDEALTGRSTGRSSSRCRSALTLTRDAPRTPLPRHPPARQDGTCASPRRARGA
jgi:hypothetical protein